MWWINWWLPVTNLPDMLVDPIDRTPLVREGDSLRGGAGRIYPIVNGIPRFVQTEDAGQRQTENSFAYKWQQRESYGSAGMVDGVRRWVVERYGFSTAAAMRDAIAAHGRVLDAGCGGGWTASLWLDAGWTGEYVGSDISAAVDVARDNLGRFPGTTFVQADLMSMPFPEESFGAIFSEGVLHHTPSTEAALKALVPLLRRGGEFLFYVYRKKGPVREFTDDYIRGLIADKSPEEAWEMLRPLTKLGQALAELKVEVDVPEAIPYLGIPAGRVDVQRLFYWHFAKLFWNERYTFEENLHHNFDWYHPRYAHRQTEAQVRQWCNEAGLTIIHFNTQESGFTVRARRR